MKYFPENTLQRFEFPKIIAQIEKRCDSDRAKRYAEELRPVDQFDTITRLLEETTEAKAIAENGIYFPEISFPNISRELGMLGIDNAVLDGQQVIKLRKVAEVAATVIRFLGEKKELYPRLRGIVEGLYTSKELISLIDEVLEPNGFVKTSASKELGRARKALAEAKHKANKAFEAAVRKYKKLGWLRDYEESIYNDRRVLAVTAENKRKIDGTLHGNSESGNTSFVEPANLVNLNNDVAESRQWEKREEYRILRELTHNLRSYKAILESYENALGFLDFTFAKARYAMHIDANKPLISRKKEINVIQAYHPVLLEQNRADGKTTIPMNLSLDYKKRILVISGPNAGGKSVSLKTFGLLQIMFQCGMLIPAEEHSQMGIFKQFFVDIGDDQSIAYELSTYSSRLVKMKHFLFHANKNTLFFIDEFGTGSDPELGGAIAETILEEMGKSKAFGVITTHYANLKILAENSPMMLNGCMLFDEDTLLPKYKLDIGQAGSSYTFEVAQKIGLDQGVIDGAKMKLDDRKVNLDKLLITLQTKKNKLNKETHILQTEKSKIRKEIEASRLEAEKYREKQENLNFSENMRLIQQGKKYDSILKDWHDKGKRKDITRKLTLMSEKEAARKKEKDMTERMREKQDRIRKQKENRRKSRQESKKLMDKPIHVGDKVRMPGTKEAGVVEEISKNKATVVFGMIRTIVPINKLRSAG
ncbi:MAG: DNA mismatch repair protein MutS [Flavobacteriales bacterium]|nr:DNA mismatch repair protein MutS [Flavobacteriales bacterium]